MTLEFDVLSDMNSPPHQAYDTFDHVGVRAALTCTPETVGQPPKADPKFRVEHPSGLQRYNIGRILLCGNHKNHRSPTPACYRSDPECYPNRRYSVERMTAHAASHSIVRPVSDLSL